MKLNQAGIDLVRHFEGCKLDAYPDPATGGHPYTIGFGSTGHDIGPGLVWTQQQADERLQQDLDSVCTEVSKLLKATISDNAFSALVCFAYNVGIHNLAGSSLINLVNAGNSKWASLEFEKWDHAGGKVMQGLLNRRLAEKALFLS